MTKLSTLKKRYGAAVKKLKENHINNKVKKLIFILFIMQNKDNKNE